MSTPNTIARAAQAYVKTPVSLQEDHRTRYIYSPGEDLGLGDNYIVEKQWAVTSIPRGVILRIGKRTFFDSSLNAGEMAQAAQAYKNMTQTRDGRNPSKADDVPANLMARDKWPIEQIGDILGQYAHAGMAQVASPLNYADSDLPAGWTVEQAVDVLDIALHPKEGGRKRIVENLTYLKEQSARELDLFLVPMRDGGMAKLPPVVRQMGLEIREELIRATEQTIELFLRDWEYTLAEMKQRDLGGQRGKNWLDQRDIRIKDDLGLPTPMTRKVEYEGQQEEKTAGMFESMLNKLAEKWPAMSGKQEAAPVVDEEALALRVMQMLETRESDIGQKAIAEAIAKGLLVAPQPEAPKTEVKKDEKKK